MDFRPDYVQVFKQWHRESVSSLPTGVLCMWLPLFSESLPTAMPPPANQHSMSTVITGWIGQSVSLWTFPRNTKKEPSPGMTWPGQDTWSLGTSRKGVSFTPSPRAESGDRTPTGRKGVLLPEGCWAGKTTSVFSTTVSYGVDYGYGESSRELREKGKETVAWQRIFMRQVGLELRGFDVGGLAP